MKYATFGSIQNTAVIVVLAVVLIAVASVWQHSTETITVGVFEAPDTIEAATSFVGTELVFEARVIGTDAARMTRPGARSDDDIPSVAYAPVRVVVTRVHQGTLREGDQATLRALGGTVDGTTYVFEGAPRVDVYAPGTNFLVFAAGLVDTGDGVMAATPNWVFLATPEGQLESALDGRSIGALDIAREMIVVER